MNDLANAEPALLARLAASAPPVPAWFDVEPTRPKPERVRRTDLELPDPSVLPDALRQIAADWLEDSCFDLSDVEEVGSGPDLYTLSERDQQDLAEFAEAAEDEWQRRTQRNVAREAWDDEQEAARLFAWRRYFAGRLYRQLFGSDAGSEGAALPWDDTEDSEGASFRTAQVEEDEDGSLRVTPHDSDAWQAQHLRRSMHAMEATLQKIHSLAEATQKEPDLRASVCAMLARGALDELRRIRSKPDTERGLADWETYLHDLRETTDAEDAMRSFDFPACFIHEPTKLRKAPALPPVLYALMELRGLLRSEHEGKSGGWANGVLHAERFVENYASALKDNAPAGMNEDDELVSSVACILRTLEVRVKQAGRQENEKVRAGMMNAADLVKRMRQDLEAEPVEKRPGYERTEHVAPDA